MVDVPHNVKDGTYFLQKHSLKVNLPDFLNGNIAAVTAYSRADQKSRILVNFGPNLPDGNVISLQIDNRENYRWETPLGIYSLFEHLDMNHQIRTDLAIDYIKMLQNTMDQFGTLNLRFAAGGYLRLLDSDALFRVYKEMDASTKVYRFHVFYFIGHANYGIFIWMQFPLSKDSDASAVAYMENRLVKHEWPAQAAFVNTLSVM